MLTVLTSSTDPDLTSTGAAMADIFGATTTDQVTSTYEIQRISTLIRRASAWAERYVQRPLLLQVYSETLSAAGDNLLVLGRRPVRAMLRLFDSTSTSEATAYCSSDYRVEDADAGFLGRDAGFALTAQSAVSANPFSLGLAAAYLPGRETRPWLAEYAAGYAPLGGVSTSSPNYSTAGPNGTTSTGRTLPEDIEQAVIFKVKEWWEGRNGVESERVGDLAVTYSSRSNPWGAELGPAEALLDPYRSAL